MRIIVVIINIYLTTFNKEYSYLRLFNILKFTEFNTVKELFYCCVILQIKGGQVGIGVIRCANLTIQDRAKTEFMEPVIVIP